MKAKTINEIHSEAEKNLGLRPGATASIRSGRVMSSGAQGNMSAGGFPINRPGSGGMMPGMPGTRKMPGMPIIDNDNWEVPRSRSMPRGDGSIIQPVGRIPPSLVGKSPSLNQRLLPHGTSGLMSGRTSALLQGTGALPVRQPSYGYGVDSSPQLPTSVKAAPSPSPSPAPVAADRPAALAAKGNLNELRKKTVSLLEEYFSVRLLDEALACVEELKSPAYHSEIVKEAISLGLEKSPACVEPVAKLIEYLFNKKVIAAEDITAGCLLYASQLDDLAIDLPKAPANFGEIVGKLILAGPLDFKMVLEILKKLGDDYYQKALFNSILNVLNSSPSGKQISDSQASDMEACKGLFQ